MAQALKENEPEQSLSLKVQDTLNKVTQMENNLQHLININEDNTKKLIMKLKASDRDSAITSKLLPTILESAKQNATKIKSKPSDIETWKPPDLKQCEIAATNAIPYTKNGFHAPSKTSVVGIMTNRKYWNTFFTPKIAPSSGDWLHEHVKDQKGQTFLQYYQRKPRYPSSKLDTIGLITIGDFNINLDINDSDDHKANADNNLLHMLSSIVEVYYGMKVKLLDGIQTDSITSRHNDASGTTQLLTTDIHDTLSNIKELHEELFCLMAVSIIDLYPRDSWNFVFGQARIKAGTGVFSFARYIPAFREIRMLQYDTGYGLRSVDVEQIKLLKALLDGKSTEQNILNTLKFDKTTQILFFRRCIKVLVHEIGHLFGIKHCIYMECIMNGSNHKCESDMKPVYLCPVCLHKLYFCRLKKSQKSKSGYKPLDILERYRKLAQLYERYGLLKDAKWYLSRVEFLQQ